MKIGKSVSSAVESMIDEAIVLFKCKVGYHLPQSQIMESTGNLLRTYLEKNGASKRERRRRRRRRKRGDAKAF